MIAADGPIVDGWWRTFVATGAMPPELEPVQARLVRAVHRGRLPSGPVHTKAMTFPRAKDRLRYLLRSLPAAHEAELLRAAAAAGIAVPEVVAVRTARRRLLPFRSLLVLRTLPVVTADAAAPLERLAAAAAIAVRLLQAGIVHPDLHAANFVRLADGGLAVLDLQSARRRSAARRLPARLRLAAAARLGRDVPGAGDAAVLAVLRQSGLLRDDDEQRMVLARIAAERRQFRRARVLRCRQQSTEFTRRIGWRGSEHRLRAGLGDGRWWRGGALARRAWLGQRVLQLVAGRPPRFRGYFQDWWWLGGGASLYVPAECSDDQIEAEATAAAAGLARMYEGLDAADPEQM